MRIEQYSSSLKKDWDEFIEKSKNGNFHLKRDFIEYHGNKMKDHSLLIYDESGSLECVFPANNEGNTICSHRGLTYGGFVTGKEMHLASMMNIFSGVLAFLKKDFDRLIYRAIPYIYHAAPAQEDLYCLFLSDAKISGRNVLPVIDPRSHISFQDRRMRGSVKALKNNLEIRLSDDLDSYWTIVSELLARYGSEPVHSLKEIKNLAAMFPDNIKLFACFRKDEMLAGVLIFESVLVARMQYIAATAEGKESGAMDLLSDRLVNDIYSSKAYIDFGTSTLDGGRILNAGISENKEGFGARSVVQDTYEADLRNWDANKFLQTIK